MSIVKIYFFTHGFVHLLLTSLMDRLTWHEIILLGHESSIADFPALWSTPIKFASAAFDKADGNLSHDQNAILPLILQCCVEHSKNGFNL